MLESTVIERTMLPAFSQPKEQERDAAPTSLQVQLRLIRDAALSLLDQIEPLSQQPQLNVSDEAASLYDEVRRLEIRLIINALSQTRGHQRRAARLLGVKATTLNAKIKRYQIPFLRGPANIKPAVRVENEVDG